MDHSTAYATPPRTAVDPVCGMTVDPAKSPHRFSHAARDLSLLLDRLPRQVCRRSRQSCMARHRRRASLPEGTIYTCPMHPEIRQIGPGSCPICGMALEPEAGGADDGGELAGMTRRLWIAAAAGAAGRRRSIWAAISASAASARPHVGLCASLCWQRPWCCGVAGRSSCAAPSRCSRAISTCSR